MTNKELYLKWAKTLEKRATQTSYPDRAEAMMKLSREYLVLAVKEDLHV